MEEGEGESEGYSERRRRRRKATGCTLGAVAGGAWRAEGRRAKLEKTGRMGLGEAATGGG